MITESRSEELSRRWIEHWGDARPLRWDLRGDLRTCWVRFHSLPDSKQYAETGAEWREVMARHHRVIQHLQSAHGFGALLVIGQDYRAFAAVEDLDRLLRDVAADEGRASSAIITDESLNWLYAPYSGRRRRHRSEH